MLETKRLYIAPMEQEDLSLLHRLFTHPFLREHLWGDMEIDLEESQKFIQANQKYFRHYSWGLWKLIDKKSLESIGFVGLWPLFEDPWPQLLYGLFPQFTGQGFATEAVKQVMEYAFSELEFPHLKASMDINHPDSAKLVKRLNMTLIHTRNIEGTQTSVYYKNAPVPHPVFNLN